MNHSILYRSIALTGILLVANFASGCTTVVKPTSSLDVVMPSEAHGVAFGTIHLIRNGKDESAGLTWPGEMKWWVEDEAHGTRFLISHLPLDGQFTLTLPAGTYRVLDISFDGTRGNWHTVLPTTFRIQSHHCTSLGMWELEMQTGFFSGWMTREVSHEDTADQDDFGTTRETTGCPTLIAPIESPVKRLVKLHFHTRGSGRF